MFQFFCGSILLAIWRVESEFDVEKDLPEFLSSVLDRTEDYISSNERNIKDLQE